MCVIIYVDDAKHQPILDTLVRCYERSSDQNSTKGNKDGVGIAWHDEKGAPRYVKGMYKPEEIAGLLDLYKVTVPYAIHFRASSMGKPVEQLIHPFPIDPKVPHKLNDTPKKGCVMQNGTWHGWNNWALKIAVAQGLDFPAGPLNDAKMIAWIISHTGFNVMDYILEDDRNGSRLIAFLPNGEIAYRGAWEAYQGMWFSQMKWNEPDPPPKKVEPIVVVGSYQTEQKKEGKKKGNQVTPVNCDSFRNHPNRDNIAKSLAMGKTMLCTEKECLMQVISPYAAMQGDKCGKCQSTFAHRHTCKELPENLSCRTVNCLGKIENPKLSVDYCTSCFDAFSRQMQEVANQ